jgi:hypothetical protein
MVLLEVCYDQKYGVNPKSIAFEYNRFLLKDDKVAALKVVPSLLSNDLMIIPIHL